MIRKILKSLKVMALLLATLFATNSCSDLTHNPMQDKETGEDLTLLLLDQNFFDTRIFVEFVDEETLEAIEEDELIVTISGKDVDKVVDPDGMHKTQFRIKEGILELAIDPAYTPTEESPLEFMISAETDEYKWYAFPQTITITEAGNRNELVAMIYEGDDDLKSAQSVNTVPPFTHSFTTTSANQWNLKIYDTPKRVDGILVYGQYRPNSKSAVFESITVNAQDNSNDDFEKTGFTEQYRTGTALTQSNTILNSKTYSNISNFRFNLVAKENSNECQINAGKVVYNNSDVLNIRTTVTLFYKDGSKRTVDIPIRKRGQHITYISIQPSRISYYTLLSSLSYFPALVPKNLIDMYITPVPGYTFTYPRSFTDPCTELDGFELVVTKTESYKPYNLAVILNCADGAIGAAPSIPITFTKAGTTERIKTFLSGGTAVVNLESNTEYDVSGSYKGESKNFSINTTPGTQNRGNLGQKELNNVYQEIISPTIAEPGKIKVKVTFTAADCPF